MANGKGIFKSAARSLPAAGCAILHRVSHELTRYLFVLTVVSFGLRYYVDHIMMFEELIMWVCLSVPFAALAGYLYEGFTTRSFAKTMRASGGVLITSFLCVVFFICLSGLLQLV